MKRCRTCFVTGTDTGVGKTRATLGLMQAMQSSGLQVSGMKPVASGVTKVRNLPVNEDAVLIRAQCSQPWDYELINPYPLSAPISPNLAARLDGTRVSLDMILDNAHRLQAGSDCLFVEGIGGWRVPWGEGLAANHLVDRLDSPVILVVAMRPGCINHALLTAEAILGDGATLAGWLANHVEPAVEHAPLALEYLVSRLPAALLGELPYQVEMSTEGVAEHIDITPLGRQFGSV